MNEEMKFLLHINLGSLHKRENYDLKNQNFLSTHRILIYYVHSSINQNQSEKITTFVLANHLLIVDH
jgi:hypothetical protein